MKVFYLFRKTSDGWYKSEIGVFDWSLYLSMRQEIDSFSDVELIGYSKYGAYLLDKKSL